MLALLPVLEVAWYRRQVMTNDLQPIHTNHLFRPLASALIGLLEHLPAEAWLSKTCYPSWTVHDIATHLLRTAISRLSSQRDHFDRGGGAFDRLDYESLSNAIDDENSKWREALSSTSPRVLVGLLRTIEPQLARYFARRERSGTSPIGVGWAGEERSEVWFETAREFTERWHHQQQIRDAVGARSITTPKYLKPVLQTLIRSLPYWYSHLAAPEGSSVDIGIYGDSGGYWSLVRDRDAWHLHAGRPSTEPSAALSMSEDTAWRFLTRSITSKQAEPMIELRGDPNLSRQFLRVVAVMMPVGLR